MKKKFFYFCTALLCAIAISSCSNEEQVETLNGQVPMTFSVCMDEGTRSSLDDNGKSVLWQEGDKISIFDSKMKNNVFTLISGAGTKNATFGGSATPSAEYQVSYPYTSNAKVASKAISDMTMPKEQKATSDTFDPEANIMIATTEGGEFTFKQVSCFVKLTTTEAYSKIVFTTNAGENIAGSFTMEYGDVPVINITANGSSSVSLVPVSGESFAAGTYFIGLLPTNMENGFTIECYNADNSKKTVRKKTGKVTIFQCGKIINLGEPNTGSDWTEEVIESPHVCDHYYEFGKGNKEYVDFDLPGGILWAKCNLGAMEPWEYGDYYAWGATEPWLQSYHIDENSKLGSVTSFCKWKKDSDGNNYSYDWNHTPYQTTTSPTQYSDIRFSKYSNNKPAYTADGYLNTDDAKKTILDPEDDAAHVQWGDGWRMPTYLDLLRLQNNTYWVWTRNYKGSGVSGYIVYKPKDERHKGKVKYESNVIDDISSQYNESTDTHIFLPSSGHCYKNILYVGYFTSLYGYYWLSSMVVDGGNIMPSIPVTADCRIFYSYREKANTANPRYEGFTIRAVRTK